MQKVILNSINHKVKDWWDEKKKNTVANKDLKVFLTVKEQGFSLLTESKVPTD